jgi:hypothetical protein
MLSTLRARPDGSLGCQGAGEIEFDIKECKSYNAGALVAFHNALFRHP